MRFNRPTSAPMGRLLSVALLCIAGCGSARADEAPGSSFPQAGAERFPKDDAVILRHDRSWTQQEDGTVRFEEHKWTKLLTRGAFRALSDPRIAYRNGLESVEILVARSHLPDGTTIDVPDYALNTISPRDVANWPAWSDWREMIVSFSGVQIGAVLELHYVRTSHPDARRFLSADLRLSGKYPVVQSSVAVRLPNDADLRFRADNVPGQAGTPQTSRADGLSQRTWRFDDLDYCGDESRSIGWQHRCGRLRFTTNADPERWVSQVVSPAENAAQPNEPIRAFAAEHGEKELDARSRVREIAAALRKRFNFVGSRRAWMAPGCRTAAEVFESNYGSGPEAAALLTAMFRSVGLQARPMVAVTDALFDQSVPTDSVVAAFAVVVHTDQGTIRIDPTEGIIRATGVWSGRTLWGVNQEGDSTQLTHGEDAEETENSIVARADLKIDDTGIVTGVFKVRLEGLFASPESLRDQAARKKAVTKILAGVLDGFSVSELISSEQSVNLLAAQAKIASKEKLPGIAGLFLLTLAADPPHAGSIHLPTTNSQRRTAVQLAAPFTERVEIVIEFPQDWRLSAIPMSLPVVSGGWGSIEQVVTEDPGKVSVMRRIGLDSDRIEAADFAAVRNALNTLRTDGARRVLLGPQDE